MMKTIVKTSKFKRMAIAVLSIVFAAVLLLALVSCSKKQSVTFENWEDEKQVEAVLGETFKIEDVSIKDTDGKVYYYEISVTDSANNAVQVVGNEFEVEDLGGYTITLSITLENGEVKTRKIIIKVKSTDAPIVKFGATYTGIPNVEYALPEISAKDAAGKNVSFTAELFLEEGEQQTLTAFENGKFTPTKKGVYEYRVTAVNSANGISTVKSVKFAVRDPLPENYLENFGDASSVLNCKNGGAEWLEEYDGAKGVVKVSFSGNVKPGFMFKFFDKAENYKNTPFEAVVIKIKASKSVSSYQTTTSFDEQNPDYNYTAIPAEWCNLVIDRFDNWNMFFKSATGDKGAQLFWLWLSEDTEEKPDNTKVDLYIDEITYIEKTGGDGTEDRTAGYINGEGIVFDKNDATYNVLLKSAPSTYEAFVKFPANFTGFGGVLFGNYTGYASPYVRLTVRNGAPCLSLNGAEAEFKDVNLYTGEFVHLAVTVDRSAQKASCYVNGELKQTVNIAAKLFIMEKDCLVGGDLCSGNHNIFKGAVKSLALFNDARTAEEVLSDVSGIYLGDGDLLGFYDFNDDAKNGVVKDQSSKHNDIRVQKVWLTESEIDKPQDFAFSFAVIGDTQSIVNSGVKGNPEHLKDIYDWIARSRKTEKIEFAMGLGDICETLYESDEDKLAAGWNKEREWALAKDAISRLDGKVPYSLCRGNHDDSGYFNNTFNTDEYNSLIDGKYNNKIENTYRFISVNGYKYLILTLDFNPSDDVLEWAGKVIEANPDSKVIITTHSYLHYNANLTSDGGVDVWEKLGKKYSNVIMILGGHVQWDYIEVKETKGDHGNKVVQMLINPQDVDLNGATGLVAMFYFSADGKTVNVRYYSTVKDRYFKIENQLCVTLDDRTDNRIKEDTLAPSIQIVNPKTGVKGEKYVLPEVRVRDLSNAEIVTKTELYLTSDANKTPIEIIDGAFVPLNSGSYTMRVTATDIYGNRAVETREIAIRETQLAKGVLEDFSNEAVTNAAFVSGAEYEYLDSFMGRSGVLHIKPNATEKSYYSFRLFNDAAKYPFAFSSIKLSVWVNSRNDAGEQIATSFYDTTRGTWKGVSNSTDKGEDGWYTVTIDKFYNWQYFIGNAAASSGAQLFWSWTKNNNIYIDEITFETVLTPSIRLSADKFVRGDVVDVSADIDGVEGYTELFVTDPDGMRVSLENGRLTLDKKGVYKIRAQVFGLENYSGASETTLTVLDDYLDYAAYADVAEIGSKIEVPACVYRNVITGEIIGTAEIAYSVTLNGEPVEVSGGKFIAEKEGVYHIVYTVKKDGETVCEELIRIYTTGNTVDFAPSQKNIAVGGSWLEEYNGAEGVAMIAGSASSYHHVYLNLGITNEQLQAKKYDYLDIRLYADGISESGKTQLYTNSKWLSWYSLNTWVNVRLYREFIEGYLTDEVLGGTNELFELINASVKNIYIDYVNFGMYAVSTDGTKHTLGFDSETDVSKVKGKSDSILVQWLKEVEGAKGVIDVSGASNQYNDLLFDTGYTAATLAELDFDYIVIKAYLKGTSSSGKAQMYYAGSWREWYALNEWVFIRLPKDKIAAYLTDDVLCGNRYLVEVQNATLTNLYIDYLDFIVSNNDFSHESEAINVKSGDNAATFVKEFAGATGVAKITYGGTYNGLFVKIDNPSGVTAEAWTAIEVRIYFENQNGETEGTGTLYNGDVKVADGLKAGWNTLTLTKEALTATGTWYAGNAENLWNTLTSSGERLFWCWDRTGHTMYVDYVKIVK